MDLAMITSFIDWDNGDAVWSAIVNKNKVTWSRLRIGTYREY